MANRTGITEITAPIAAGSDKTPLAVHFANEQQGGLKLFFSVDEMNQFAQDYKPRLYRSSALIPSPDSDQVSIYNWTGKNPDGSDGQWHEIDFNSFAGLTFVNPDGSTTTGIQMMALSGLTLEGNEKDGFTLKAVANNQMTIGRIFSKDYTQYQVSELNFAPPIELVVQRNSQDGPVTAIGVQIKPGTFAPMTAPGYLAYLQYPVEVVGKYNKNEKYHKGSVWFDMMAVSPGPYIYLDRDKKAIGIQDYLNDDPNVTGGVAFLIWPFIYLDGEAPNDGFVELVFFNKQTGEIAKDNNDHPIAVRHNYKAGDPLTPSHAPLTMAAVINAKGITEYALAIVDNFEDDVIKVLDYAEGPSGICIQALSKDGTSSDALTKAEIDTGFSIRPETYYIGQDFRSLSFFLDVNEPAATLRKGQYLKSVDGVEIYACENMGVEVSGGTFIGECKGLDICDFYLGIFIDEELSRLISGREISIDIAIEDKDDGWIIGYFTYNGEPSQRQPIFQSRNNGSIILNSGWSQWGSDFISEDAISGIHSAQFTTTVPKDATFIVVAIYPVSAQNPMSLRLKKLSLSLNTPYTGYEINGLKINGLQHLDFITENVKLTQDTQGFAALRYTINNDDAGNPMPLGIPERKMKYLTLDASKNVISGSTAKGGEGALVANDEVKVTASQKWQLYNEQISASDTEFWLMLHSASSGQDTEIPGSRTMFVVSSKRPGVDYFTTNEVTFDMEPGDYFYARSKSDSIDGAYAQTNTKQNPLCITYIKESGITS